MSIAQLVDPMFEQTGYKKTNLQFILSKLPECLRTAIEKDQSVQINGIGTFSLKVKKARTGRNPSTGEPIQIPEKTFVHFKMHKALRDLMMEKE
jgi:DNA-binding protein HU-beta